MSSVFDYSQLFARADTNRDGTIDDREFRSFLGPVRQDKKNRAAEFTEEDRRSWDATPVIETITYEIGLDVALYGFVEDPIKFEIYSPGISHTKGHSYGIGPDVGIGAPNIAPKLTQYDAAGSMFYFADFNHDMKLDQTEFSYFMRSI